MGDKACLVGAVSDGNMITMLPNRFKMSSGAFGSGGDRQLFGLTAGKPTLKVRFPKAATGW
ncbi:MAG: hypothetical protein JSR28_15215 [Proteobacteria bacterium]|nr:hypothetical protein [Pseudomonadota bacterium]